MSRAPELYREQVETPVEAVNLEDYRQLARAKLSQMAYDYFASGAEDEQTLRQNREAFARLKLAYRVLVDVSRVNPATEILGQRVSMPVLTAPMAFQQLAHAEGELAMARAAGEAGTVMILSTLSNVSVEKVTAAAKGSVWFQLYVYKDRGASEALVARAERAGCRALVLTVDAPVLGRRERDMRNRFHLPDHFAIENLLPQGYDKMPQPPRGSGLASYFASLLDPALTWRDVSWLRSKTKLPLLIKGIVRPDDAVRAAEHGASGIVVSNHGGRQLDGAPPTIEVLPAIAEALQRHSGTVELLVDGGVRRGTDVVKALALGARAVLLGRPLLWGLAAEGAHGAKRVFSLLRTELETAMALCGCPTPADIDAGLIWRNGVKPNI